MAKVGMRNIKTAISVFICLVIYILLILIIYLFNRNLVNSIKSATQLYTPFFACLATAYSVSTTKEKSLKQGRLRLMASVIGGCFGLLIVALYQLTGHDWPFQHISATGNPTTDSTGLFHTGVFAGDAFDKSNVNFDFLWSFMIPIIITTLAVVLVIWFCNQIKQSQCAFIAVLTLTAVMASLGTNPIIYGPNRILSTVVGIGVAILVNNFKLPRRKNKNSLFIFGIDAIYKKSDDKFGGLNQYVLDNLIQDGANVTIFTTRAPATFKSVLSDAKIDNPIICMSGAAVYDFKKEEYLFTENIDDEVSQKLSLLLDELNVSPFVNFIKDNLQYVYTKSLDNVAEMAYFNNRKNEPYRSFNIIKDIPTTNILYYLVCDTKEKVAQIEDRINNSTLKDDLLLLKFDVYDQTDENYYYQYLKIYSKKVLKLRCLDNYRDKDIFAFGLHENDFILLDNVKYSISSKEKDNNKLNAKLVLKDNKVMFSYARKLFSVKKYQLDDKFDEYVLKNK